jgi:hypothetical protein
MEIINEIEKFVETQKTSLEYEKEYSKEEALNSKKRKLIHVEEVFAHYGGRSKILFSIKGGDKFLTFKTGDVIYFLFLYRPFKYSQQKLLI